MLLHSVGCTWVFTPRLQFLVWTPHDFTLLQHAHSTDSLSVHMILWRFFDGAADTLRVAPHHRLRHFFFRPRILTRWFWLKPYLSRGFSIMGFSFTFMLGSRSLSQRDTPWILFCRAVLVSSWWINAHCRPSRYSSLSPSGVLVVSHCHASYFFPSVQFSSVLHSSLLNAGPSSRLYA